MQALRVRGHVRKWVETRKENSRYLRREHAEVPRRRLRAGGVAVPVGAAGALDVAAEPGDADHLDQRHLHRRRRRHVDGIHGVVGHALPDARQVQDDVDAERPEVVGRADAAEHQLLRAAQRPRREDHLVGRAAVQVRHVSAALRVAEHHASRHRLGPCKEKELQRRWHPTNFLA
jgi:hypothetical protein